MVNQWTIAYATAWFFSSLLFTRHFFEHVTYMCSKTCSKGQYGIVSHSPSCRKGEKEWRHAPLQPGEAAFMALFWPMVLLYGILLWNHLRAPFSLRTKKKQRVLTDAELKRLDEILYADKEVTP